MSTAPYLHRMPLASTPMERWERDLQVALFLLVAVCSFHLQWAFHGEDPVRFLSHKTDTLGYYQWLPAVFVDHAVDKMYWCHQLEDGRWLSMFTLGAAVLWAPFFLLGHAAAWAFGYAMDGFSAPYAVAFMFGSALYAGAGCVVAFRLARGYSATMPALAATVLLFAGTNLFHYAVVQSSMSHLLSFLLIGTYAWCSVQLLHGGRAVHALLLPVSGALLLLIRPLNGICLPLPLLLAGGVSGLGVLWRNVLEHRRAFLVGLGLSLVPWMLQMAYWFQATDQLLVFTYGRKGEHFEWDRMVPGMVLFSVRNGWLVYSPLFIPVLAVLVRAAWVGRPPARTVLLLVMATLLLYSAWWCWFLGCSFGHRGFVDLYGLLAVPLAWAVGAVQRRGLSVRLLAGIVVVVLLHLNMGLTARYEWLWSEPGWTWQHLFAEVSALLRIGG